jgi:hypothetical protein
MGQTKYERGFLTPEQEKKVSFLGLGGAEGIAELLNPYPKNLQTGKRELAAPGLFEGIAMGGRGIASAIKDPSGTYEKLAPVLDQMGKRMVASTTLRPGQMEMVDGELRPLTSEEVVQERIDAGMDPTVALAGGAPIVRGIAKDGIGALAQQKGVVTSGGDLFGPENVEGVARSTVRGPGSVDVPLDRPFYNAGEAYASEIVEPIALTTLKKRVNKEKELSDTDRKFLFDAMDKAVDDKGMITPDALRKVVNEQSQISDVRISAQRPVSIFDNWSYGLDEITSNDYKQAMGRENNFEVDNPTGQAEVGAIRISLPKSRFKEKSRPLSAEEVDKVEKEGLEAQLKLGERNIIEIDPDTTKRDYTGQYKKVEDSLEKMSPDDAVAYFDRDEMRQAGASQKEIDAAFPPNPDILEHERLRKELKELQSAVTKSRKKLDTSDRAYQGPGSHFGLSDDVHKAGEAPLAFARYVQRKDVFHPDNIDPYIGVNSGQRGSYHQLLDIQSDYINDAAKGVNVGEDVFPDATSNTKTIRTATVRAAMKDALENGQQGVILPSEFTSNRPDLYKMEDMGEMATEIAKEFGDDFKAVEIDVPAYKTAGADDLSDAGISTDADIEDGVKYKHWAIVRKLDSEAEAPKSLKFATGGLVSLPPRTGDGIVGMIRKYRREGLMD